jgi:predicted Zn finger-like uncharacterized protein
MYSQCPECFARFRVTAAVLRVASGEVRCGRCGLQFNALERLSDTLPPDPDVRDEPEADTARGPEAQDSSESEDYHFSADDLEKVFIDARDWQRQYGTKMADATPAEAPGAPAVVVDEARIVEDITLEGVQAQIESAGGEPTTIEAEFDIDEDDDGIGQDDDVSEDDDIGEDDEIGEDDTTSRLRILENVPNSAYPKDEGEDAAEDEQQDEDDPQDHAAPVAARSKSPPSPAPPLAASQRATAPARAGGAGPEPSPVTSPSVVGEPEDELPHMTAGTLAARRWSEARSLTEHRVSEPAGFEDEDQPHPRKRWQGGALSMACAVLALLLAAQLTHHFRQQLARNPTIGPILRLAYDAIGRPLEPNWDLGAFELRQWGQNADIAPGASMTVHASLTNRADFAQPYPLLRLEFEDRYGDAVAQRDFAPAEYLKNTAQATRQLAAGATTEAELTVVTPGPDAVGYTLDICVREDDRPVRCAQGKG